MSMRQHRLEVSYSTEAKPAASLNTFGPVNPAAHLFFARKMCYTFYYEKREIPAIRAGKKRVKRR